MSLEPVICSTWWCLWSNWLEIPFVSHQLPLMTGSRLMDIKLNQWKCIILISLFNKPMTEGKKGLIEWIVLYTNFFVFVLTVFYVLNCWIFPTAFCFYPLEGHGNDFGELLSFYLYYLQCFGNTFLMINHNLRDSRRVTSDTELTILFIINKASDMLTLVRYTVKSSF